LRCRSALHTTLLGRQVLLSSGLLASELLGFFSLIVGLLLAEVPKYTANNGTCGSTKDRAA
jgi:hypothetical protein